MSTRKHKTQNRQFFRYCRQWDIQTFPRPVSDTHIRGLLRQLYDIDGVGGDAHTVCDEGHLSTEAIEWCLRRILEHPEQCSPDSEIRGLAIATLLAYRSLPRDGRFRIYNSPF